MSLPDGGPARTRLAARPSTPTAGELAWIALIPCALVTVAAIALLGPPLGHALFPRAADGLWPPGWWETRGTPEPVKQGRVLVATLAPALLIVAIVAGSRARVTMRPPLARALAGAAVAATAALVAVALLEQHPLIARGFPTPATFRLGAVLVAGALTAAGALLLRRRDAAARLVAFTRETAARRAAALAAAVAFTALWLLSALTTDALSADVTGINLPWTFDDAIAVLEGRTPLVDFHPIYAKLLPYATAPVLGLFGTTIFVYTAFMALLNGAVLLAVYAIFRRVARSSLLALALFGPFVAASDVGAVGNSQLGSPLTLSAMWPMRYGGAFLLAWLTARCVDGSRPRRLAAIGFAAGLVAINNLEFGAPAACATLAALLCARPPRSPREAIATVASVGAGVLAAAALVALFTLVRAGALPDPGMLLEWPRIFTRLGWFSLPLPTWELHLAIYATFVAAIAVAAVRLTAAAAAARDDGTLLTSMLVWSGVFGLLIGGYYAGRPDISKLGGILSAWSFALSMLAIASLRSLAERRARPAAAHLLVLFGLALSVTLLARAPQPQRELDRLTAARPAPTYLPTAERFVRARTQRGEKVAILVPMGHRIAHDLGLENVSPYSFMNAIVTRAQLRTLLDAVQDERVHTIFTPVPGSYLLEEGDAAPQQLREIVRSGFELGDSAAGIVEIRRR